MDPPPPPQRQGRPALARTNSTSKPSKAGDKDGKTDDKGKTPATHRGTRYKEKFQQLREKYEQVSATHEQYQRELAIANEKIRRLQNECNLLLDAVDIAAPGQPSILHYLSRDPIPPEYHTVLPPVECLPLVPPPPPPHATVRVHVRQHTNGTNGHDRAR